MSTPNKAAKQTFDRFLATLYQEERVEDAWITAPMLNQDGQFDGLLPELWCAAEWFDVVEPLLYEYIGRVPGYLIEGKAIIVAYGIIPASYGEGYAADRAYAKYRKTGEVEQGEYKLLATRLTIGKEKQVEIDREQFDDWLELKDAFSGFGVEVEKSVRLVMDDEESDSEAIPALSYEEIAAVAKSWGDKLQTLERPHRDKVNERLAQRVSKAIQEDRKRTERALRQAQRVQIRREELKRRPNLKDPLIVPAANTRLRLRSGYPWGSQAKIRVQIAQMPERIKARGVQLEKPHSLRTKMIDVDRSWLFTGYLYGVLLEPVGGVFTPPESDFLAASLVVPGQDVLKLIDLNSERNWCRRIDRRYKHRGAVQLVLRYLERRYREMKGSDADKMRMMGSKYRLGEEPKTYYLGHRTGNLYPAKFIRYAEHFRKYLPENSKYGRLVTEETVLAQLLDEPPYCPFEEFALEYRLPENLKAPPNQAMILCFEDELVTVPQGKRGEQRMERAELHRYIET